MSKKQQKKKINHETKLFLIGAMVFFSISGIALYLANDYDNNSIYHCVSGEGISQAAVDDMIFITPTYYESCSLQGFWEYTLDKYFVNRRI